MTPGAFSNCLKGIGGEFELIRVVGFAGALVFMAGAVGFQAWNMVNGHPFDLTAWSIAFPGGLAGILVSIGGGTSLKDRNVAVAKATEAQTKSDTAAAHAAAGTSSDAESAAAD